MPPIKCCIALLTQVVNAPRNGLTVMMIYPAECISFNLKVPIISVLELLYFAKNKMCLVSSQSL